MGIFKSEEQKQKERQNKLNDELRSACINGLTDSVQQLLKAGADPCDYGYAEEFYLPPPLHYACNHNPQKLLPLMLASSKITQTAKFKALNHACSKGYAEAVTILIENGVLRTPQESGSWTPLHYAANYGRFAITQMLLEHDIDLTARDSNGNTAADLAKKEGHHGIADLLQKKLSPSGWQKIADDEITLTEEKPEIGYRLLSIFNFKAATYTRIARNVAENAESQVYLSFEQMPDKNLLRQAHEELISRGGKAPAPFIGKAIPGMKG